MAGRREDVETVRVRERMGVGGWKNIVSLCGVRRTGGW